MPPLVMFLATSPGFPFLSFSDSGAFGQSCFLLKDTFTALLPTHIQSEYQTSPLNSASRKERGLFQPTLRNLNKVKDKQTKENIVIYMVKG